MKYSINWLQQQIEQGIHHDYLFFWGHTPKQVGIVDKSCFSQWYPAPFEINGINYKTTEHWMMAQKAKLFGDGEALQNIIAAERPIDAKAIGRTVKNFDVDIWNSKAFEIVVEGNYYKFSANKEIRGFLINTGNTIIVEASPNDAIWGIGLPQDSKNALNPNKWRGTNLLGFALMEVRDQLTK
jgi:ribA/ribD-fused uncharacterized protein